MSTQKAALALVACALLLVAAVPGPPAAAHAAPIESPYGAGREIVTITRPGGQTFTTQLFYPATSTGNNTPYDPSGAPYPVVTFAHGFTVHPNYYRSTMEHLAANGYFVAAPESYTSFWFPSHQGFANDLRYSLDYMEARNADPASWLFGQVDMDHVGMTGHSMGGGCSILATAADSRVKALIPLAAAETNPSAIALMPSITVPVRLMTGDQDGTVNWQTNTLAMYNAGGPPRQLPLILGGWHCGFLDSNILFCDSGPLPRAEQLEITRRELVSFFDLYLKPDADSWREVWGPERDLDPRITLQSDPGIGLNPPSQSGQGAPGSVVSYNLTVTNLDAQPTSYTMLAEDDLWPPAPAPWPVTFVPSQTPVLGQGESAAVVVQVHLPGTPGPDETILLSARSDLDGGTRAYATVTTEVMAGTMYVDRMKLQYRLGRPGIYKLVGQVRVLTEGRAPVVGATVSAEWLLPDGQTLYPTAVTAINGAARFQLISGLEGLYTITVLDVEAEGLVYDPEQNRETSKEVMVP